MLGVGLVSCGPGDAGNSSLPVPHSPTATPTTTAVASTTTTVRTFIAPSTTTPLPRPPHRAPGQETETLIQPGDRVCPSKGATTPEGRGYDPGEIDGQYGPAVQAAVRAFQRVNDLAGDGIVGPLTLAAFDHQRSNRCVPKVPPPRRGEHQSQAARPLQRRRTRCGHARLVVAPRIPFCENGVCGDAVTPVGDFTAMIEDRRLGGRATSAMYTRCTSGPTYRPRQPQRPRRRRVARMHPHPYAHRRVLPVDDHLRRTPSTSCLACRSYWAT